MKLSEIQGILEATVASEGNLPDIEIRKACGCDLMSDVLSFVKPGALLLTGLTNPQVVRTVEIAEMACVCFVRGKQPSPETVALANEKSIVLLSSQFPMFEACGRLHRAGLSRCADE